MGQMSALHIGGLGLISNNAKMTSEHGIRSNSQALLRVARNQKNVCLQLTYRTLKNYKRPE